MIGHSFGGGLRGRAASSLARVLPNVSNHRRVSFEFGWQFDKYDYEQFRNDMHAKYRKDMGLPAKGEGWINQTFLLRCVEGILPGLEVIRESSPSWLNGQRLDIYIPSLKCAIEYQGEQHYFALDHFGGEQGLKDRKEMDERKKVACIKEGVMLIEWRYDETISVESVVTKLRVSGINVKD